MKRITVHEGSLFRHVKEDSSTCSVQRPPGPGPCWAVCFCGEYEVHWT